MTVGDALISVAVNLPGFSNVTVQHAADKQATVFWVAAPKMTVTAGQDSYAKLPVVGDADGYFYTPAKDGFLSTTSAVALKAEATIAPFGLDLSSPQIRSLRIGIVQDVDGPWSIFNEYGTVGKWLPAAAPNQQADFPIGASSRIDVDRPSVLDVTDESVKLGAVPLYSTTFSTEGSFQQSTQGRAENIGGDTPSLDVPGGLVTYHLPNDDNAVASYRFKPVRTTFSMRFVDYAVLAEITKDGKYVVIAPLAQSDWALNIDSDGNNQKAQPGSSAATGGSTPTKAPFLKSDGSNPLANVFVRQKLVPVPYELTVRYTAPAVPTGEPPHD